MISIDLSSFSPKNLQKSLLNYLFKRFIGPILKDGGRHEDIFKQENSNPSQPGLFIIKNVELNPTPLNDFIQAFSIPIPLTIANVSISELSLQIDWPTWSFSLTDYVPDLKLNANDVQINLEISSNSSEKTSPQQSSSRIFDKKLDSNLSNIANDFVRQEWPEPDEEDRSDQNFPGAFTFQANPSTINSQSDDHRGFFANLVQSILNKFNFQLSNLLISLNHQNFQTILSIEKIISLNLSSQDIKPSTISSRELRISLPILYLKHLPDSVPSSQSSSSRSSSSDLDMIMSQAIADLRLSTLFSSVNMDHKNTNQAALNNGKYSLRREDIFLQFIRSPAENSTYHSSAAPDSPPFQTSSGPDLDSCPLDSNHSLRFIFSLSRPSSETCISDQPAPPHPSLANSAHPSDFTSISNFTQDSVESQLFDLQVYFPILSISIQHPQQLFALNHLISSLIPLTSTMSAASSPTSSDSSPLPTPLSIHAVLGCRQISLTLNTQSTLSNMYQDAPLSVTFQATKLKMVYCNRTYDKQKHQTISKGNDDLQITFDQIHGTFNIWQVNRTNPSSRTFFLVPVRDLPGPAMSICHTVDAMQIVFNSVWLNPDLEILVAFRTVLETMQTTFSSMGSMKSKADHTPASSRNKGFVPSVRDVTGSSPKLETFTLSLAIPCLYIDLKAPSQWQQAPMVDDHRPTGLVLGAVIKSLEATITSHKLFTCSAHEAALGFRVGATESNLTRAALSPFLGIADIPISSTDSSHACPGFRMNYTLVTSGHDHIHSQQHCFKPTTIDLQCVTINLTKEQFDRTQYWLDDLSRWIEGFFGESRPFSHQNLSSKTLEKPSRQSSLESLNNPINSDNQLRSQEFSSKPLAALNISQVALTLHLSPFCRRPRHQDIGVQKLVLQIEHLSLHQLLPPPASLESQLRLSIKRCMAALHNKNEKNSLLEIINTDQKLPESMPAVFVGISTAKPQGSLSEQKQISVCIEISYIALHLGPNCIWTSDLVAFLKAPAGVFETVGPQYQTQFQILFVSCALNIMSPFNDTDSISYVSKMLFNHIECQTRLSPATTNVSPQVQGTMSIFLAEYSGSAKSSFRALEQVSFAQIAYLSQTKMSALYSWEKASPTWQMTIHQGSLDVSLCADSMESLGRAIESLSKIMFSNPEDFSASEPSAPVQVLDSPIIASSMLKSAMKETHSSNRSLLMENGEDLAFEDYPSDATFVEGNHGSQASTQPSRAKTDPRIIMRWMSNERLNVIDDYLVNLRTLSKTSHQPVEGEIKLDSFNVTLGLYDGFDWSSTRQTIQEAQRAVRKRLQKIRQLLATGNVADATIDEDLVPTTLFKSFHVGLPSSSGLSRAQLLNAIDDELENSTGTLKDELESMTGSWQSLPAHSAKEPSSSRPVTQSSPPRPLDRSTQPMLKFVMMRLQGRFRKFEGKRAATESQRICSLHLKAESLTVIDNIRTSTWKKFLTELRPSEGGMLRPTGAPMLRVKFEIMPSSDEPKLSEALLKLKISPLRLYVDQDAVDFLKRFFAFQKDDSTIVTQTFDVPVASPNEMFFQRVEILPIKIRLDYKPKRINYMALKEGKAIELMNFFHFEGSDMVLRHATLIGVSKVSRIGELLQDIWTPDVKANQLTDVISGIAPVRSVVNVGSGLADLLLLPIEQVRKDGRFTRGLQKGTTSFAKNTALEAVKLGAKLTAGTQVILQRAETILGARLPEEVKVETVETIAPNLEFGEANSEIGINYCSNEMIHNKYSDQPRNLKVGAKMAYQDLKENMRMTAQTILAVPLEVFNEGSGQAIIKAIPIAILHPMIGTTMAINKTLIGLRNSIDSNLTNSDEDKYK
ncbi:hypothetical protein O181_019242 [Austropuccinia psidii MF-1]|uniref:Autophagy-related protein 2 n=1 Tax=Austropuccinia psidii MF-1 TaxID=1389203 RepID=A0A9Q3C9C2_9BASI|nr:hypothetical protein [Austropuccinia psidii MF-1]